MTAARDLTGRMARCSYDLNTDATTGHTGRYEAGPSLRPSDPRLPFFEYQGPGSRYATEMCKHCMYSERAHDPERTFARDKRSVVQKGECPGFEARGPADEDKYHCGCFGWD